jgi:hypothetical protein
MPVLNLRAILAGLLVDIAGSFAAWLLVLTTYASMLLSRGVTEQELEATLRDPAQLGNVLFVLMLAGVFFDGLAGYITARMAPRVEYWNVLALVGLLGLMHLSVTGSAEKPVEYQSLALIAGIVAAFWGGRVAKNRSGPHAP